MSSVFPEGGMGCPVLGCSTTHFLRHKQLVNHWKKFHEQFVTLFRCEACHQFFGRKGDAQQHLRRTHRMFITPWNKQNNLFIHPGSVTMPRMPRRSAPLAEAPMNQLVPPTQSLVPFPRPPVGWPPKAVNSKMVPSGTLTKGVQTETPTELTSSSPSPSPSSSRRPNAAREEASRERKRIAESAAQSPLYHLHCRHEDHLLPFDDEVELDYD